MQESGAYALGMRSTPPAELADFFTCKSWGLPNGKGWLDEPVNYTQKISIAGNSYNAIKSLRASRDMVKWHNANPELSELVTTILNDLAKLDI